MDTNPQENLILKAGQKVRVMKDHSTLGANEVLLVKALKNGVLYIENNKGVVKLTTLDNCLTNDCYYITLHPGYRAL